VENLKIWVIGGQRSGCLVLLGTEAVGFVGTTLGVGRTSALLGAFQQTLADPSRFLIALLRRLFERDALIDYNGECPSRDFSDLVLMVWYDV
jgi:hypothetical protein